jgi:hypothetical protein
MIYAQLFQNNCKKYMPLVYSISLDQGRTYFLVLVQFCGGASRGIKIKLSQRPLLRSRPEAYTVCLHDL